MEPPAGAAPARLSYKGSLRLPQGGIGMACRAEALKSREKRPPTRCVLRRGGLPTTPVSRAKAGRSLQCCPGHSGLMKPA